MPGDSTCTFTMTDGGDPVEFFAELGDGADFREADLRACIEEYRTEVLDKTMYQGVDFEGNQFVDYNETRPYYYDPSPGGTAKQQKAAVNRFLRRSSLVHEHYESIGKGHIATGGEPSRTGRTEPTVTIVISSRFQPCCLTICSTSHCVSEPMVETPIFLPLRSATL